MIHREEFIDPLTQPSGVFKFLGVILSMMALVGIGAANMQPPVGKSGTCLGQNGLQTR